MIIVLVIVVFGAVTEGHGNHKCKKKPVSNEIFYRPASRKKQLCNILKQFLQILERAGKSHVEDRPVIVVHNPGMESIGYRYVRREIVNAAHERDIAAVCGELQVNCLERTEPAQVELLPYINDFRALFIIPRKVDGL